MKKTLSLLLCAVLILGLCACGAVKAPVNAVETATETDNTVLSAQEGQILLAALSNRYDPAAPVLTADGREISWSVYYYLLQNDLSTFLYYGGLPTDFSVPISEEETMDELLLDSTESYLRRMAAAGAHSTLTEEELDEAFAAYWEDMCEQMGDEETLLMQAAASGYTKDSLKYFYTANNQLQDAFEHSCGENFADISDQMIADWVVENGYVRAKHILLMTNDESLTDADKAEKKQQLESVRAELLAIEDDAEREAAFDDRMDTLSEDTGLMMYPDGYVFTAGTMVQEFEDAAFALAPYELSEVVETSYGYHLLMGLCVERDNVVEYEQGSYTPITLANKVANDDFSQKLNLWAEDVDMRYAEAFSHFSVQSLFEGYQEILEQYSALLAGDGMAKDGKIHVYPYGSCDVADTTDSAFIEAARYYESGHLILTIDGRDEVFCHVPGSVWEQFQNSEVKGTFYKKYLKGNAAYALPGAPAGKEVPVVVEE